MVNIQRVAEIAGVSPATVSRVINGTAKVSQEKREKVLSAIAQTEYVPSEVARTLLRKSSMVIGLIAPSILNPYFTELASYLDTMALEHGFRLFICNTGYDLEKEKAAVHHLISLHADAIIVASCSQSLRDVLSACPIPVVALDAMLFGADIEACVYCDYYWGGRLAAEHLIEKGCKNIVCIKGPQNRYSARSRYEGYRDVCAERGIAEQTVECDYDFVKGMEMTKQLLSRYPEVDGIFACNDMVALSTFKVLHSRGIHVPESVQLVGFDDISFAGLVTPGLTTVKQPIKEMAAKAMELIVDNQLSGMKGGKFIFPVKLVTRQTTL